MTSTATAAAETVRIESPTASEENFLISMIEIGERHREEFGDLEALASSIKKQGLLQPIGINENYELVFGQRRLRACQEILKWETIPVRFVNVTSILDGEVDENAMRKNHTVSELVAIVESLRDFSHGGDRRSDQGRTSDVETLTIDQAAKRVGLGNKDTFYRAKKVVENGVPELVGKMDQGDIAVAVAAEIATESPEQQRAILADTNAPLTVKEVKSKKSSASRAKTECGTPEIQSFEFSEDRWQLHHDSVEDVLPTLPDNHFDGVLTDPPYGLGFMGQSWDGKVPSVSVWKEILRVCKPGAYMLAFGGTRTWHRLAVEIEDAGWEIRDTFMWLYGEGLPKGHDISKAVDKELGAERKVVGVNPNTRNTSLPKGEFFSNGKAHAPITAPETEAAVLWDGYNTSLKPSWEPVLIVRKPLDGTYAENALKWGCGGLNIGGCRIGSNGGTKRSHQAEYPVDSNGNEDRKNWARTGHSVEEIDEGRWPANVILDGEAAQELDSQSGQSRSTRSKRRSANSNVGNGKTLNAFRSRSDAVGGYDDEGGASRFFYCPKASAKEKVGNHHPTVKPLTICEYLARLILQPKSDKPRNFLVPFAGSGSEMLGGLIAGWDHVTGIERDADYVEIAQKRLGGQSKSKKAGKHPKSKEAQVTTK